MFSILALASLAVLAAGYPNGPPVGDAGVCQAMDPTGHGSTAQNSDAPYEYVMSQSCYKENMKVHVSIKSNSADKDARYFEGFFTQVQEGDVTDVNYGTFTTEDTEYSSAYTCFENTDSSVGHKKEAHFATRVFTWTAPASGLTNDVHFRSTIVKNKKTYWLNVMSSALSYNASCTVGEFTEESLLEGEDDASASAPLLPGVLAALAMFTLALLLQ